MSGPIVIYVHGIAGMPEIEMRGWIVSHKDTPDGRGRTVLTTDKQQAKTFRSTREAFEFYRQDSQAVPLRPDGKPNRPLTAYTVEIHLQREDPQGG